MAIDTSTPVPSNYWTLHTQWGIPTVVFMALLRTNRFKLPPAATTAIFTAYLHVTTGGLGLLFTLPLVTLLSWSILVITTQPDGVHAGVSILFGGLAIFCGVVGFNRWSGDGWLWRTPIAVCFVGMGAFYFVVAFMLSFYGVGITFFGNSVHFVCLNFLCIVELMCITEDTHRVDIDEMLELNETDTVGLVIPSTPNAAAAAAATAAGSNSAAASGNLMSAPSGADTKKDDSALSKKDVMISVPPTGGAAGNAGSGDAPAGSRQAFGDPLQEQFRTVIHKRQSSQSAFAIYYGFSVVILTGYAVAVWFYLNPNQSRYAGIIVAATIVVIDGGLYLYATTGRLSSNTTKLIVLAGTRIILISFGENNWFIGVAAVYVLAGCWLSYAVVDWRWPLSAAQEKSIDAKAAYKMRFSEFMSPFFDFKRFNTIQDPERSGYRALLQRAGNAIIDYLLIALTLLLIAALIVAAVASTQSGIVINGYDQPQWRFGIAALLIVAMFLVSCGTLRMYRRAIGSGLPATQKHVVLLAISSGLLYIGSAVLFYLALQSVVLITAMMVGPFLIAIIAFTYMTCVRTDWRLVAPSRYRNPPLDPLCHSLWCGGLPIEDYQTILSVSSIVLLLAVIGLVISLTSSPSYIGWSISFVLFILLTTALPLAKFMSTLDLDTVDRLSGVVSLLAVVGFCTLVQIYVTSLTPKEVLILWAVAATYVSIVFLTLGLHRARHTQWAVDRWLIATLLVLAADVVGIVIAVPFVLSIYVMICLIVAALFIGFLGFIVYRFFQNNYNLSRPLQWAALGCFGLVVIFGIILGLVINDSDLAFWSYSASWHVVTLFVVGAAACVEQQVGGGGAPTVYSPYVFPVYQYDLRADDVKLVNGPTVLRYLAFALWFLWSIVTAVRGLQSIGLGCSALGIIGVYVYTRQCSLSAADRLASVALFLTSDVIRKARADAKSKQMDSTVFSLSPATQAELSKVMHFGQIWPWFRRRLEEREQRLGLSIYSCDFDAMQLTYADREIQMKEVAKLEDEEHDLALAESRCVAHFLVLVNMVIKTKVIKEEGTFAEFVRWLEKETGESLELTLTHVQVYGDNTPLNPRWSPERIEYMRQKKQQFELAKRSRNIDNDRYHQQELEAAKAREEQLEANMKKRAEVLAAQIAAAAAAGTAVTTTTGTSGGTITTTTTGGVVSAPAVVLDPNDPHGSALVMKRYAQIQEEFKRTGKLYEDTEFPAGPKALYVMGERDPTTPDSALHAMPLDDEWLRPKDILIQIEKDEAEAAAMAAAAAAESAAADAAARVDKKESKKERDKRLKEEKATKDAAAANKKVSIDSKEKYKPILHGKNGYQMDDVVQGSIGDCYLMSAVGVTALREQNAKLKQEETADTKVMSAVFGPVGQYQECGAYVLRFYQKGFPIALIIDDKIPVYQKQLAFSRNTESREMWVALLEKAYAKMFGSYEAIEAGKVHQALVDLTNGASEEIRLSAGASGDAAGSSTNLSILWTKLNQAFSAGYLIGAGTNSGSDTKNAEGIFFGHAYAVVALYGDENEKLIQLRNPWGHGEWTGDWCDESDKWTRWWINKLKFVKRDDGVFWMSFSDFLQYFSNLYICRLMPCRIRLDSCWKGESACGPTAPTLLPHFSLTVTEPMNVFLVLEQEEVRGKLDPATGQKRQFYYIQFYVIRSKGERVPQIKREIIVDGGWANGGKLVNDRSVSAEVMIDTPNEPYAILCVARQPGNEGSFILTAYSAKPIKLVPFKDNIA